MARPATVDTPRILVVTTDPLTARMAGPAIRAWHLAEVLAADHEVVLASTVACDQAHPAMRTLAVDGARELAALERRADIVIAPAGVLYLWPELEASDKVVVFDIYDPYHLENLEPMADEPLVESDRRVTRFNQAINAHLARGDLFLCASERQRDFWLGSLAALGRVNARTYAEDPSLGALVAVVPFGLDALPPRRQGPALRGVVPGIGADDEIVLWAGGVYNWLDPLSPILATERLRSGRPRLRTVFLGGGHPNPDIPAMRVATEARALSDRLGLTGTSVFFNDDWVPYRERAGFLLDANVGISTHHAHLETRFAFRTRVLDYLWAGLPMVLTGGDVLGDLVGQAGVGVTVEPGDIDGIAAGIEAMLDGPVAPDRFSEVTAGLTWDRVAAPLVHFCAHPRRAPDLSIAPPCQGTEPSAAAPIAGPAQVSEGRPSATLPAMSAPADRPASRRGGVVREPVARLMQHVANATAAPIVDELSRLREATDQSAKELTETRRVLGDQVDAADDVSEAMGRVLARLGGQLDVLAAEVAQLRDRIDQLAPDRP